MCDANNIKQLLHFRGLEIKGQVLHLKEITRIIQPDMNEAQQKSTVLNNWSKCNIYI